MSEASKENNKLDPWHRCRMSPKVPKLWSFEPRKSADGFKKFDTERTSTSPWFLPWNLVPLFSVPKVSDPTKGRDLVYGTGGGQMWKFVNPWGGCLFINERVDIKWEMFFVEYLFCLFGILILELAWIFFGFASRSLPHRNILQGLSFHSLCKRSWKA